jgi:hypothetical protein
MTHEYPSGSVRERGEDWEGRYYPVERRRGGGLPSGLVIGGLLALGLGAMAWYYLGPDFRRYMKIKSM